MLPEGEEHDDHPARRGLGVLVAGLLVSLLVAGVAGAAAFERLHRAPARFASSAMLFIDQEPAVVAATDNSPVIKLTTLRIKYVDLVGTQVFNAGLAQQLGLPLGQVAGNVVAVAPLNSLLLQVVGSGSDPTRARTLAQGAADKLVSDLSSEQTSYGIVGRAQVRFTVVTPAQRAVQIAPSRKKAVEQGGAVAVVLLVAGAGLTVAFWRRR